MTHTDNGTSCATCREVRRNTRRIAARRKTCEFGVDPLHYPNVRKFPKQITSSCTFGISMMFCVVSPVSKFGDVLSLISKFGDVLKIVHSCVDKIRFSTSLKNRNSWSAVAHSSPNFGEQFCRKKIGMSAPFLRSIVLDQIQICSGLDVSSVRLPNTVLTV